MKSNASLRQTTSRPVRPEPRVWKAKNRIAALIWFVFAGGAFLALSGCASTNETSSKGKQALVCPQCKMVAVTVNRPYFGGAGRGGHRYGYGGTQTVYNDTCPGCQGAIETFFKEGKLKHKCSVCKESPFTCPVFHPTNS